MASSYVEDPTTWNPWTRACMLKGRDDLEMILEGQCPTCLRSLAAGLCGVCGIRWSASIGGERFHFTACREVAGLGIDLMEWHWMPSKAFDV